MPGIAATRVEESGKFYMNYYLLKDLDEIVRQLPNTHRRVRRGVPSFALGLGRRWSGDPIDSDAERSRLAVPETRAREAGDDPHRTGPWVSRRAGRMSGLIGALSFTRDKADRLGGGNGDQSLVRFGV
jgi:hypothetical protein